jgi:hypothetical protein
VCRNALASETTIVWSSEYGPCTRDSPAAMEALAYAGNYASPERAAARTESLSS